MSETTYGDLASELVALGRAVPAPEPSAGLPGAVLARVARRPAPTRPGPVDRAASGIAGVVASRRRAVAATVVALLVGLLAAPPVRAAVADWFGFAGVRVELGERPGRTSAPPPPPAGASGPAEAPAGSNGLAQARRLVAFDPVVPPELGAPDAVEVSDDRRVLSMSWDGADGPLRLDQFDGRLDYAFAKSAPGVRFTSVAGEFAVWFPSPHEVVVLEADGSRRTETARLAGHTLIWERRGITLRLEGDVSLARAREVAGSAGL